MTHTPYIFLLCFSLSTLSLHSMNNTPTQEKWDPATNARPLRDKPLTRKEQARKKTIQRQNERRNKYNPTK